jgi:hypothetical protein
MVATNGVLDPCPLCSDARVDARRTCLGTSISPRCDANQYLVITIVKWSARVTLAAILVSICSTHHVVCDDASVVAVARGLCDVIDVDMVKMGGELRISACV